MLFFGDNGQGDLMCAERLTGMNGSPSEDGVGGMVSAAFIHQAGVSKELLKVSSFTECEKHVFHSQVADPAEQLSELEKFEDHQQAKEVGLSWMGSCSLAWSNEEYCHISSYMCRCPKHKGQHSTDTSAVLKRMSLNARIIKNQILGVRTMGVYGAGKPPLHHVRSTPPEASISSVQAWEGMDRWADELRQIADTTHSLEFMWISDHLALRHLRWCRDTCLQSGLHLTGGMLREWQKLL